MIVGVMTQPLRTKYAVALLGDGDDHVLITTQHADFSANPLPDTVTLVLIDAPGTISAIENVMRGPLARRLLRWARSGSPLGRQLERLVRRVVWRTRQAAAAEPSAPASYRPAPAAVSAIRHTVESHDVDRIICFDVFDLLAVELALAASGRGDLPVAIR